MTGSVQFTMNKLDSLQLLCGAFRYLGGIHYIICVESEGAWSAYLAYFDLRYIELLTIVPWGLIQRSFAVLFYLTSGWRKCLLLSEEGVLFFCSKGERRIFTNFHRQVFCWTDQWYGMTMADIRVLEDRTKVELDEVRKCYNHLYLFWKASSWFNIRGQTFNKLPAYCHLH